MVVVGQAVLIVDEKRQKHPGLVTAVHGYDSKEARDEAYRLQYESLHNTWSESTYRQLLDTPWTQPSINAVFVSTDPSKRDPYGWQLERLSSLQHRENAAKSMEVPGRYWDSL